MSQVPKIKCQSYYCNCLKIIIPQNELSYHLKIPLKHEISKIVPPIQSSKDHKNSILAKIQAIIKIQAEVQQASINLINTINLNTILSINKLSQLIATYKAILSDPFHDKDLKNKKILSNLTMDKSLMTSLVNHFGQKIVHEGWTMNEKCTKIKNIILHLFEKKCSGFKCMAIFNDENFLATAGYDGFIRVWDVKNNRLNYCLKKYKGDVYSVALGSKDELILAGYGDCAVRLWDLRSRKMAHKFVGHTKYVYSVLVSDDNHYGFSSSWDNTIKIWGLGKKEIERTISTSFEINQICFFNGQNSLIAAGTNGSIAFWNRLNKNLENTTISKGLEITSCCLSKNEHYLILGNKDGSIKILTVDNLKIVFEDKKHTNEVCNISISSKSHFFATCSINEQVLIWDLKLKSLVHSLTYDSTIMSVAFLKTSDELAICFKYPKILYIDLKKDQSKFKVRPKHIYDVEIAISSNLKYIAYSTSKLTLLDLETSNKPTSNSNNLQNSAYLKFSPDGSYLICGCLSGEVLILNVPDLSQAFKIQSNRSKILCAAISSNNKYIASAFLDKKMIIQSFKQNQVVFTEENVFVECAIFCYKDKRFAYTVRPLSVHVLNEHYNKVNILHFECMTYRLISTEDDKSFIVSDTQSRWSCINSNTTEIIYQNKTRKEFKKWSAEKQDSNCQIFLHLVGVNF